MSLSRYPQITEDLLSDYLDDLVSDEERQMIEKAVADDPQIAWQLASLQQTVSLLQNLSALALPRSFTIDEAMLDTYADRQPVVAATPQGVSTAGKSTAGDSWWQKLLAVLQGGNAPLRNAASAAAILLVILVAGSWLLSPDRNPQQVAMNTASTATNATATTVTIATSENTGNQEVAVAKIATPLSTLAPETSRSLKQPEVDSTLTQATEQPAAESIRAQPQEPPANADLQEEPIALALVTTPDTEGTQETEGTVPVEPTATSEPVAVAAAIEPQVTTATESDNQRSSMPESTLQSAPPAAASLPFGDDTQPLEGEGAAPMALALPIDSLTMATEADNSTGTMQPPATAGETPEINSTTANVPATTDEAELEIRSAAVATVATEAPAADEQLYPYAADNAQDTQLAVTATTNEIGDTNILSITATSDLTTPSGLTNPLATTTTELSVTAALSEQVTVTTTSTVTDTVVDTVSAVITNTVTITDTLLLSPTISASPTRIGSPTITLSPTLIVSETVPFTSTARALVTETISETDTVTATRNAESTQLAPLTPTESISATEVSLMSVPTTAKATTRRSATVTPLHTPVAPPEVTATETMTITARDATTKTMTVTSTPTMTITMTPTTTPTLTTTAIVTGTLTPDATSLGQGPVVMLMNMNSGTQQLLHSSTFWGVQVALSLLLMLWGTLWMQTHKTVQRQAQLVESDKIEHKDYHA